MGANAVTDTQRIEITQDVHPILKEYFENYSIRVAGDATEPLFCVKDVAEYIGDTNYKQRLVSYKKYIKILIFGGPVSFFTEAGLYIYLCQHRGEFFHKVCGILREIRKKVVDDATLESKITQDGIVLLENRTKHYTKINKYLNNSDYHDVDLKMDIANAVWHFTARYIYNFHNNNWDLNDDVTKSLMKLKKPRYENASYYLGNNVTKILNDFYKQKIGYDWFLN